MIASFIIYSNLDLVRLVNIELVQLVQPAIVSGRLRTALDAVFNFDVHEGFRSSTKATGCRVVDIGDSMNAEGQVPAQGFALAGHVETIICA